MRYQLDRSSHWDEYYRKNNPNNKGLFLDAVVQDTLKEINGHLTLG